MKTVVPSTYNILVSNKENILSNIPKEFEYNITNLKDFAGIGVMSNNTLRAYSTQWRLFLEWCIKNEYDYLPCTSDCICEWMVFRFQNNIHPKTIGLSVSAISKVHRLKSFNDPTKDDSIKNIQKIIAREQSILDSDKGISRQAIPLHFNMLKRIIYAISDSSIPDIIKSRDKAMLVTHYMLAARVGEIAALRLGHLSLTLSGDYSVMIARSKTDQTGIGRLAAVVNSNTIPAADILNNWVNNYPFITDKNDKSCPLFPQLHYAGNNTKGLALSEQGIRRRINYWGNKIGINNLTGHSLRRGAASDAVEYGARETDLMRLGGWKTLTMPVHYVAERDAVTYHPLRGI